MTVQIIQQAINNKNWSKLQDTTFLSIFSSGEKSKLDQISFNKEVFTEFIFNSNYFIKNLRSVSTSNRAIIYNIDSIIINICKTILNNNFDISVNDWKNYIKNFYILYSSGRFNSSNYLLFEMFSYHNKNTNYLKALTDDNIYKQISDLFKWKFQRQIELYKGIFDGLTATEIEKLKNRLSFNKKNIQLASNDKNVKEILKIFSFNEILELYDKRINFFIHIDLGYVLEDYSQEDYFTLLKNRIESGKTYVSFVSYFKIHKDLEVPNWLYEFLFDYEDLGPTEISRKKEFIKNCINNLTEEQIDKQYMNIPTRFLIKKTSLHLSKITEYKGKDLYDLTREGLFYTEEEIAENPHFFNPEKLSKGEKLYYVTEDTFKLLNKTWGKRQRYNNDLTDFFEIVNKLSYNSFTIKNIKYLQEKTNVKNTKVINLLKRRIVKYFNEEKLAKCLIFLKKYEE